MQTYWSEAHWKKFVQLYQSYAAIPSNKGFMSLANYLTIDYDNDGNDDNANETDDSNDDDVWLSTLTDSGRESTLGSSYIQQSAWQCFDLPWHVGMFADHWPPARHVMVALPTSRCEAAQVYSTRLPTIGLLGEVR